MCCVRLHSKPSTVSLQKVAPTTLVLGSLTDSEDTDTASSISSGDDLAHKVFGTLVDMACFYGSLDETAAREATLTAVECSQVELATRAQAGSDEWFRQRKGRITASVVGKVISCCTGVEGVVSQVMGYTEAPNVSSVRWGRDNEVNAKNRFINDEGPKHKGFEVRSCGLFVDEKRPYLGASPDGIVSCSCCKDAVLEIKCAASCAHLNIDAAKKVLSYLDNDAHLKENHSHYAQVQMQMALTKTTKAFFVVYTKKDFNVEEVAFDESFWVAAVNKAEEFFFSYIFTEIHSRDLLAKITDANTMCVCKSRKSGSVLRCESCAVTVHMRCVKLKRMPRTWVCSDCRMQE